MHKKALAVYMLAKGKGYENAMKAVSIAYEQHEGQKRQDGADYIEHVIGTCHLLIAHGIYDDLIWAAAILHDVIEDTNYSYEDIVKNFNKEIADIVDKVTKRKGEPIKDYMERMKSDIRAVLIKAADRTHNVSDMVKSFSPEKMSEYIEETEIFILVIMKWARRKNIRYDDTFIALSEHIKSVLLLAKKVVELEEKISLVVNK